MILILVWIDVGELETSPRDLSMLSDVVKMMLLQMLNIINWLKQLMLFRLPIPVI